MLRVELTWPPRKMRATIAMIAMSARMPCEFGRLDRGPTTLRVLLTWCAQEDEGDDRDDGDEREDQRVLGETLAFLVTIEKASTIFRYRSLNNAIR